jgi:hypothetical protein
MADHVEHSTARECQQLSAVTRTSRQEASTQQVVQHSQQKETDDTHTPCNMRNTHSCSQLRAGQPSHMPL